MQRELAAGRRTGESGRTQKPSLGAMNANGLRGPWAQDGVDQSCQEKEGRDPHGYRRRSRVFARSAQNLNRNSAAIGQQQLCFHHIVLHGMRLRVEGQLVAQAPGENTDPQQDEGRRQRTQFQPAAGQANPLRVCGIWRRSCQGRMDKIMPHCFDVFKTDCVSSTRNRFPARDLQCPHAIR